LFWPRGGPFAPRQVVEDDFDGVLDLVGDHEEIEVFG
jgi:hypothetical protein